MVRFLAPAAMSLSKILNLKFVADQLGALRIKISVTREPRPKQQNNEEKSNTGLRATISM